MNGTPLLVAIVRMLMALLPPLRRTNCLNRLIRVESNVISLMPKQRALMTRPWDLLPIGAGCYGLKGSQALSLTSTSSIPDSLSTRPYRRLVSASRGDTWCGADVIGANCALGCTALMELVRSVGTTCGMFVTDERCSDTSNHCER